MNKRKLHKTIECELDVLLQTAKDAALQAYETATNKETVAENKYDTFALEASYLAAGQSKRIKLYEENIDAFKTIEPRCFSSDDPITLGALVVLIGIDGEQKHYFISPVSGGLKVEYNSQQVFLVTPRAPLAKAMAGLVEGDEFEIVIGGKPQLYSVLSVS